MCMQKYTYGVVGMKLLLKMKEYLMDGTLWGHLHIFLWDKCKIFKLYVPMLQKKSISERKIVFCNFSGKGYGGDPKYVAEYIIKNNLDFEMVWLINPYLCNKNEGFPTNVRVVSLYSFKAIYELATAHFWIDNSRKLIYPTKKKQQVYIQTWHGTFPTKFIEKDAETTLPASYIEMAKKDSANIDYILSGSKLKTKIYQESFYFDGPVLEIGTPKEDIFFDKEFLQEARKKVYKNLQIEDEYKIILYAPTFRSNRNLEVYDMDYIRILNAFAEKTMQKYKLLVRFHPNIIEKSRKLKFPNGVINVTEYSDMQELLGASDVIISDYSSTLDYSIFDKKVFLYCPDIDEYQAHDRQFYIKLEDLPFPLACTNDKMVDNIMNFDEGLYFERLRQSYDKYGLCEEGCACMKLVQLMENLCNM